MKIKLDPEARVPRKAHADDAGYDLYSREDKEIPCFGMVEHRPPLEALKLPPCAIFDTGVHIAIPSGYYGKIESKSGLNVKYNVVSCGGVVDSGYTGSIAVKLYNFGTEPYEVHKGDKIAQIVFHKHESPEFEIVDELDDTERGDGGFGSTGR